MYRPRKKFTTPLLHYELERKEKIQGSVVKIYKEQPTSFFGSFATYGGTPIDSNGVLAIEDTAKIETWYNPQITSESRIQLAQSGETYEVMGEPEDLEERHIFMKMKVKRVKGGR